MKNFQPSHRIGIFVCVLGVVGIIAVVSVRNMNRSNKQATPPISLTPAPSISVNPVGQSTSTVTADEKTRIDAWITENDLNEYGDPKDTLYTGGTPLFNEMTGEQTDRYEYILKNNPDQPWNK